MKSKNIDKSSEKPVKKLQGTPRTQITLDRPVSSKIEEHVTDVKEQDIAIGGLTLMLERLVAYFQHSAMPEDRETLVFCLHHLFRHVDTLYCETLPALTTITHTRTASSLQALKTRITFRYTLWTRLQQMLQHIERIESLCHLLNRTIPRLLGVLDTPDIRRGSEDAMISIPHLNDSTQAGTEQWQQAYEQLTTRLSAWQERNGERLTFASNTSSNESVRPSGEGVPDEATHASIPVIRSLLTRIDASLMLVLDSAGAIFGDIVPDFQVVARGDDEVVATLLFDLMQQGDLLLIQCDALFGPLQDLIRHYMLFE